MRTRRVVLICLALVALGLIGLSMGGCVDWFQPKVESPLTHRLVGAEQLQADYAAAERNAAVTDAKESAEATRIANDAKAKAQTELLKLDASNQSAAADIILTAQLAGSKASADYSASSAARKANLDTLAEQTQGALSSIETQAKANAALWSIAKPFVSMVPGGAQGASAIDTILTAGIGGVGLYALKKRRDAKAEASDHADTRAELAATRDAAGRVVDSIDVLAAKAPEVAAAIKAHGPELKDWQGDLGRALVDALQKGRTPVLT